MCCSTDCARFNSARKGSHFKASTTIPALQFSFNRRVVELQQWFASYQIKALCDDEGNMKIKNTIKNLITLMTIAYYSHNKIIPLIMLLLITGMTNPWIYQRHYGHKMAFNPMIQRLVCFRHLTVVLFPPMCLTWRREHALYQVSSLLHHDDLNYLSQDAPKPHLRIRYSLNKCRNSHLCVYVHCEWIFVHAIEITINFLSDTPTLIYLCMWVNLLHI